MNIKEFWKLIREHEEQIFGITLFNEGIKYLYAGNSDIINKTEYHYNSLMERGNTAIEQARKLLKEVQESPEKMELLDTFVFPPIHGHPDLEEMTTRAKILVETYNELFPDRSRELPLSGEENKLLMETSANKWQP